MRLAILVTVYASINVTGLLVLRRGMSEASSLTSAIGEPRVLLGGVLYATSFLLFIASLRYYPVTMVVPLFTGSVYLCSTLLAWWILGEHVGPRTIIGIAAVGLGILIVPK
jgi:drug/metabolite transporter (DMT)-like permease